MTTVVESPATSIGRPGLVDAAMRPFGKTSKKFWAAIAFLTVVVAVGVVAWIVQLRQGMGVAGYGDRSFWAIYMADVVAFIGVSYGGAVVSAILLLTGAKWRAPLSRLAEGMALVTVVVGSAFLIPHLGRPDRFLGMVTQPNFASPIFWDFVAITTYTFATAIFFLLPLVPDVAILQAAHPEGLGRARRLLYRVLSRGWVGSAHQRRVLRTAMGITAIVIIPLAVAVHSVLSWAFALVSRPGWHESIWAPYFVIAALYSGVALVVIITAGFRRGYHLQAFITERHFVRLGYIMVALGAAYLYLTFADLLPGAYVGERSVNNMVYATLVGDLAPGFWFVIIAGEIVPLLLIALPQTRKIWGVVTASILVVSAMWLKRVLIVVGTAAYDHLTDTFGAYYRFTWVAIAVTLAGVAAIPLLLMLLFRIVPLLAIDEIQELTATATDPAARPASSPGKASRGRAAGVVGGVMLVMVFLGAIGVDSAPAAAAAPSPATPPAAVAVSAVVSGPQVTVTARVTAGGTPVQDAQVRFFESTEMFAPGDNQIPLGKVVTDRTGTAVLRYQPAVTGPRTVSATYYADVEGEPATASAEIDVTEAVSPYTPAGPRLLAGVGRALVNGLFVAVFLTCVLVIAQVIRVRRACRPGSTPPT